MLTKSRLLRTLDTITKTVGSKPAARTASKSTSTRGWPAFNTVTRATSEISEALALKFSSVDSDMQHHLSRAVVGHDTQRVLSRKQRRDGTGDRSAHCSLLGNHGNAIAHGTGC